MRATIAIAFRWLGCLCESLQQPGAPFEDSEFRSLPKHLEAGNELRNLLEAAIEKIPIGRPSLVKGGPARNR